MLTVHNCDFGRGEGGRRGGWRGRGTHFCVSYTLAPQRKKRGGGGGVVGNGKGVVFYRTTSLVFSLLRWCGLVLCSVKGSDVLEWDLKSFAVMPAGFLRLTDRRSVSTPSPVALSCSLRCAIYRWVNMYIYITLLVVVLLYCVVFSRAAALSS